MSEVSDGISTESRKGGAIHVAHRVVFEDADRVKRSQLEPVQSWLWG